MFVKEDRVFLGVYHKVIKSVQKLLFIIKCDNAQLLNVNILLIKYVCFHRFIPSRKYGDYSQPYPVASSYHYDPLPPPPTFSSPTDPTHPHTTPSLQVL